MKRTAAILLAALLLFAGVLPAGAAQYQGTALDRAAILEFDPSEEVDEESLQAYELAPYYHIQYELDTDTGLLRIYPGEAGAQDMLSYARYTWLPWSSLHPDRHENIRRVVFEDGVQTVGRYSFFECGSVEEVWLPRTLRKIDQIAFYQCTSLRTVYYPGTEDDFYAQVRYLPFGNYYTDASGAEVPLLDFIHFGEHVTVECVNQEGETFRTYTVGGYETGDAYTVRAEDFEGMTCTSRRREVSGNYRSGDGRVIRFEYACTHEYSTPEPGRPCDSACVHCGHHNPDAAGHTWASMTQRTLFHGVNETRTCLVCGKTERVVQPAYIWFVAAGAGALVILAGIVFLVSIPIRKRKKVKDLTW